ncbi:MAG: DoxX family protein [Verrucomicrobiota bacterium]|jgi:uncharacterized membrane protein YphA (DoxX/SURF4 family)
MNTSQSSWSRIAADTFAMLARWLLGAVFLYLGLNKALHPVEFLKLVRQYDLVQSSLLLNSIAAALPWFEIFCGLLLLAGVAVRGTAVMLIVMLVPFTVLVFRRALAIQSVLAIPFCAVKFDCGCGTGEVFICRKLVENFLFIVFSGWLLGGYGRKLCVRHSLMSCAVKTRPSVDGGSF